MNNDRYKIRSFLFGGIASAMIAFWMLGRCLRTSGYYGIALVITLLFLMLVESIYNRQGFYLFFPYDIFFFVQPLLLLRKDPQYLPLLCIIWLLAWIFSIFVRSNYKYARYCLAGGMLFSVLNAAVNVINIVSPSAYFSVLRKLLYGQYFEDAQKWYYSEGYLCGLSDHYSRNAYFTVLGITIALSAVWAYKKKNKILSWIIIGFGFVLLLRIGKRGHLVFLLLASLIVYLMLEPKIHKKLIRIIYFILALLAAYIFISAFIPNADYVIQRFTQFNTTHSETNIYDDITHGRYLLYALALKMFKQHPVFGAGYGAFSVNSIVINGDTFAGVHNDYLQWLCEEGIVGFCINIVCLIVPLVICFKELKLYVVNKTTIVSENIKMLIIWSMLFQIFVITYSLTGLPHFDYEVNFFYLVACAIPMGIMNIPLSYNIVRVKKKVII